jgi:hypothetical protein
VVHAQGHENPRPHQVFPCVAVVGRGAEHLSTQGAGGDEAQIRILGALAKVRRQRQIPHSLDQLAPGHQGLVPGEVVARQAGTMGQEVADGDMGRRIVVGETEPGQVVDHPIVPGQASVVDQGAESGAGERLGGRGDSEDGVRGHGQTALEVTVAESLRHEHVVLRDHRQGEAGDLPGVETPLHDAADVLHSVRWRRSRRLGL